MSETPHKEGPTEEKKKKKEEKKTNKRGVKVLVFLLKREEGVE